jgi:hypothetical protein
VSSAAVRHRADLESRSTDDVVLAQRSRSVWWWYEDEGRRFRLSADLPAAQGAVIARAIEREAEKIPPMPDEDDDPDFVEARRADALLALCSARVAADPDPDRATVVIHAQVDLDGRARAAEIEGGPAIHPDEALRMLCNARGQTIVEDSAGDVLGVGRIRREPPAWMLRQLRYRDRECRFPGCGARRFAEAHHIVWWRHGGRTELGNLVLICSFHHRLVHELGWRIRRKPGGEVGWFRPDGTPHRAGPSLERDAHPPDLLVAAS